MEHGVDKGSLLYKEERNLTKERRLLLIVPSLLSLPILIIVILSIHLLWVLVLLIPIILIIFRMFIEAQFGRNNLEVYENGFIPPTTPGIRRNLKGEQFIPYSCIDSIYKNPTWNGISKFKRIAILKKVLDDSILTDSGKIKDLNEFYRHIKLRVSLVNRDIMVSKYRHQLMEIYPKGSTIEFGEGSIDILIYKIPTKIPLAMIKKINLMESGFIQLKGSKIRIGIWGYPMEKKKELQNHFLEKTR